MLKTVKPEGTPRFLVVYYNCYQIIDTENNCEVIRNNIVTAEQARQILLEVEEQAA